MLRSLARFVVNENHIMSNLNTRKCLSHCSVNFQCLCLNLKMVISWLRSLSSEVIWFLYVQTAFHELMAPIDVRTQIISTFAALRSVFENCTILQIPQQHLEMLPHMEQCRSIQKALNDGGLYRAWISELMLQFNVREFRSIFTIHCMWTFHIQLMDLKGDILL